MSLMSKTRVESHTQKRSDERGALMLEAIALLGLMTLMSPMLVKQTSEKTQEVEEVTVAGQMKMLRDAAMSYIDANLGSLGDTSASGAFGGGYTGADGEKQSLVLDNRQLAKFLPPGFCLEENGTCVFQNRLADNYRAAIVRQHSCDTRGADNERTDECKPFDYTVLVVSGPRADNGTANEITDRRAMRIAAMIGADGGFIPSANMAAVTGDASKVSVLGAQGIWEIPDVTDFFAANSSWQPGRGQVAVTTVYKGNSNLGEFLYRKPTSVEGGNAMFTDLDMAGRVGVPNDDDGTVTDEDYGRGTPHDIKGAKGIFMASDGGLYVRTLPRNTTLPGDSDYESYNSATRALLKPQAQFTRQTMSTGEYAVNDDDYVKEHRIRHNLDDDGYMQEGETRISHKEHRNAASWLYRAPGGFRYVSGAAQANADLSVSAPEIPADQTTEGTLSGMSFNSGFQLGGVNDTYRYETTAKLDINAAERMDARAENLLFPLSTSFHGRSPHVNLSTSVDTYEQGMGDVANQNSTIGLEMKPNETVVYPTLTDSGAIGSAASRGFNPTYSLGASANTTMFHGGTGYLTDYKSGLYARAYSNYVDELVNVPRSVMANSAQYFRAGNGNEIPSLSLEHYRNFNPNRANAVIASGLDFSSASSSFFDKVSLYSTQVYAADTGTLTETRSYVKLDELPFESSSTNNRYNYNQSFRPPTRFSIGSDYTFHSGYYSARRYSGLEGMVTSARLNEAKQDMSTGAGKLGAGYVALNNPTRLKKEMPKSLNDYIALGSDDTALPLSDMYFVGLEYNRQDRRFGPFKGSSPTATNSADMLYAPQTASLVSEALSRYVDSKAFISAMSGRFETYGEENVDYEKYMDTRGSQHIHRKTDVAQSDYDEMRNGLRMYAKTNTQGFGSSSSRIAMKTRELAGNSTTAGDLAVVTTSLNMENIAYGANDRIAPSVRLGAQYDAANFAAANSYADANLKMYAYEKNPKASLFVRYYGDEDADRGFVSGNSAGGYGRARNYDYVFKGGLETQILEGDSLAHDQVYLQTYDEVPFEDVNTNYGSYLGEARTRLTSSYEGAITNELLTEYERGGYYDADGVFIPQAVDSAYYATNTAHAAGGNRDTGEAQLDLSSQLNLLALGGVGVSGIGPIPSSYQDAMQPASPVATLSAVSSDVNKAYILSGQVSEAARNNEVWRSLTKAAQLKLRSHSLSQSRSDHQQDALFNRWYHLSYIPSLNLSAVAVAENITGDDEYGSTGLLQGSTLEMDAHAGIQDTALPQLRSSLRTERVLFNPRTPFRNIEEWQNQHRATSDFFKATGQYTTERASLNMTAGRNEGIHYESGDQLTAASDLTTIAVSQTPGTSMRSYAQSKLLADVSYSQDYHGIPRDAGSYVKSGLVGNLVRQPYSSYGKGYSAIGMSLGSGSTAAMVVGLGVSGAGERTLDDAFNSEASQSYTSPKFGFLTKIEEVTGLYGAGINTAPFGRISTDNTETTFYKGASKAGPSQNFMTYPTAVASIPFTPSTVSSPPKRDSRFYTMGAQNKIIGGLIITSQYGNDSTHGTPPIAEFSTIVHQPANTNWNGSATTSYGRLQLAGNGQAGIDLDTRYWKIRDGYIEVNRDEARKFGDTVDETVNWKNAVLGFTYDSKTTFRQVLKIDNDTATGGYNYSTGRRDSYALGDGQSYQPTSSMFRYGSIYNEPKEIYDAFRLDPAYVSVMNDIKLTSRGGANLSDILPNYVLKSIYTLTNQYAKGPWPCDTTDTTTRNMAANDGWKDGYYNYYNSNPGNCSFVVPRGRLAKLPAEYKQTPNDALDKYHYVSRNSFYTEAWETDCSLMNRFGYRNYCTISANGYQSYNVNPRSMFVSYAANNYFHCSGGSSAGCLTHPFMGVVPAPGMYVSFTSYNAPGKSSVVGIDDHLAGICPAGYLPVMTVTPTAFDVGKVIFIDAGSNSTATTMPTQYEYTGGESYVVNDLSKLPIVEEEDGPNVDWHSNPEEPKTYAYDVIQTSRRFQNFGHQDYRTEVPFIYQPATRIAVAAKPLCAQSPAHCLQITMDTRLRTDTTNYDCGKGGKTLCGWAVAMGTVTPNKVKTSATSPDYFWNMGGIFSGSMQALVHTYCYFDPQNFKFPNAYMDYEQRRVRPVDNPNLYMKHE